jgi:hypothetical protein
LHRHPYFGSHSLDALRRTIKRLYTFPRDLAPPSFTTAEFGRLHQESIFGA